MKTLVGVAITLAVLVAVPVAAASPPIVSATAAPASGLAPLTVSLTATGDAASYHWDLGDGTAADGAVVRHVYPAGTWTATVTATSATGEASQAAVTVRATADSLSLRGPAAAAWDSPVRLSGRLASGRRGLRVQIYRGRTYVASATTRAGGAFSTRIRFLTPGRYEARHAGLRSPARAIRAIPRLVLAAPETAALGETARANVRVEPRWAGRVHAWVDGRRVRIGSGGSLPLGTARTGTHSLAVRLVPNPGFAAARRTARTLVVVPVLSQGARGPAVRELERRLRDQRYALKAVDGSYDLDTVEAVYAFQSVHGLAQTGRVDAALWRLIARSSVPLPRYPGSHIEVSKGRQFLLDVRGGFVVRVVHVSTGATGNTPLGTWHVYRTVPGFDWVLYYPQYFLRGFAIHGYPSVPPYPASHGCVRVPMWLATTLFSGHGVGTTIVIY